MADGAAPMWADLREWAKAKSDEAVGAVDTVAANRFDLVLDLLSRRESGDRAYELLLDGNRKLAGELNAIRAALTESGRPVPGAVLEAVEALIDNPQSEATGARANDESLREIEAMFFPPDKRPSRQDWLAYKSGSDRQYHQVHRLRQALRQQRLLLAHLADAGAGQAVVIDRMASEAADRVAADE